MNSNYVTLSRRSLISLLLGLLLLILAAAPALAWLDEGDVNGWPAHPCRVVSDGQAGQTVTCMEERPDYSRPPAAEQPLLHPAVARAEQMSMPEVQVAEASAQ